MAVPVSLRGNGSQPRCTGAAGASDSLVLRGSCFFDGSVACIRHVYLDSSHRGEKTPLRESLTTGRKWDVNSRVLTRMTKKRTHKGTQVTLQRGRWRAAHAPPSALPTVAEVSASGAWWFSRAPSWTRRHVVTIKVKSDRDAELELAVDIELPRESDASRPWGESQRLFVVPLLLVTKAPRLSQFELTDETGALVHTYRRSENESISICALEGAVDHLLPNAAAVDISRLKDILGSTTRAWQQEAELYAGIAQGQLRKLAAGAVDKPGFSSLVDLARDLSASTMIWVPIVGLPGQRRTFRLTNHFKLQVPWVWLPLWRKILWLWRKLLRLSTLVETERRKRSDIKHVYEWRERPKDANTRGTLRRMWNRGADTFGFAPYQLHMEAPYLRRTRSYHLQVEAPVGIDVRVVRLLSRLKKPHGRVYKATAANRGHLYFSDASGIEPPAAALIHLRVGRRGPLFFSALTSTLVATMLWLFAEHAEASWHETAAASTLLVVPALMIVFASRPGEHALVTRLLSGVRLMMLLVGACSVVAAAGVAGILPFGQRPDNELLGVSYNWHVEAKIATAISIVLVLSWLLAFHGLERAREVMRAFCRNSVRYTVLAFVLVVVQLTVVHTMPTRAGHDGFEHLLLACVLALVGLVCAWGAGYGEVNNQRVASAMLAALAAVSIASVPVFFGYDGGWLSWRDLDSQLKQWIPAVAATAFALQALTRPLSSEGKRRAVG